MVWPYLVAGFVLLTPLAVGKLRADYRRHGRLTALGLAALTVWFFLPHLTLDYVLRYVSPWGVRQYAGLAVISLGAVVAARGMTAFASWKKIFALDPGSLTVTGPYRRSRNPQYVGWFLFVGGFAVLGWTWKCAIALGMLAFAIHLLVLVEEEHLERVFGEPYRELEARVPRYFGLRAG